MADPSDETCRAAAREVLAAFGVGAERLELTSRSENITLRVEAADGAAYNLRLHRPGYQTLAELQSERIWTRALSDDGHPVPEGIETPDGRSYVPVEVGDHTRLAGMTRWIEGEILAEAVKRQGDAAPLADYFVRLGEIAAGLHAHAETWRPPAGFTRRAVDAEGLMGEAPHWGAFWEHAALSPAERQLMATTRRRLFAVLAGLPRDPASFGMIHADLHHGNLLLDGERLTVIDFDDAAFGWYLYDLAVSMQACAGRPDYVELQAALLRGYRTRRPLSAEAEARLPLFVLARAVAVLGWLHQRPEIDPGPRLIELKADALTRCEAFEGEEIRRLRR